MAYSGAGLSQLTGTIGGQFNVWVYRSTDAFSVVDDTDYFLAAKTRGVKDGDFVFVIDTDSGSPPAITLAQFTLDADGNGTAAAVAFAGAASFTTLTATGNVRLGDAAADLVGFHNSTGISQRAAAAQATTALASSTDFGATQLAAVHEIMNTLILNGLWKGAA